MSEVVAADGTQESVAVRRRLYASSSSGKPQDGMHISISDNMTSKVSRPPRKRAPFEFYSLKSQPAVLIEVLVAQGAVIAGKSKLCVVASGAKPTDQWIDPYYP